MLEWEAWKDEHKIEQNCSYHWIEIILIAKLI
jgi:hypothetical protein